MTGKSCDSIDSKLKNSIKESTRFYKETGGQILLLVSILTICWLIGYFNWSLLWIYFILSIFVSYGIYKHKSYQLFQLGLKYTRNEKEFLLGLNELNSWTVFPDVERAEWLNKIILRLWPSITIYLKKFLETDILPNVQKKLSGLSIRHLTFGDSTPKIGGIKIYDAETLKRDEIFIDLDVYLYSDLEIQATYKKMKFGIKDFEFKARVRIHATPLMPKIPFIGAFSISFLQNPHIAYEFTDTSVILSLPFLRGLINESLIDVIADLMVIPNRIPIKLISDANMQSLMFRMPECVMRINIIEAKKLLSADLEILGKNKSDPYVNVRVGAQKYQTKVINNNLNPVWNEAFEAIMESSTSQLIELEVYDKDQNKDDFLGRINIEPRVAYPTGIYDKWMELEDTTTGTIHMNLVWLQLSDRAEDFELIENSAEIIRNPYSTALFYFCLDSAKHLLSSSNQDPSAYAEINIGNERKKSSVKKKTQNPTWENQFQFLIKSIYTSKLDIEIKDDRTKKSLGYCEFKVADLIHVPKMEKFDTIYLKGGGENSTIQIYVALRALVPKPRDTRLSVTSISQGGDHRVNHNPRISVTDDDRGSDISDGYNNLSTDSNNNSTITSSGVRKRITHNLSDHQLSDSLISDIQINDPEIGVTIAYKANLLTVTIINITGINSRYPIFVKLYLHPKDNRKSKRRSKTSYGTEVYQYNEQFEFQLDSRSMLISNLQMDIKCAKKSIIKPSSLIGSTEIDLAKIHTDTKTTSKYPIRLRTSKDAISLKSMKSETSV